MAYAGNALFCGLASSGQDDFGKNRGDFVSALSYPSSSHRKYFPSSVSETDLYSFVYSARFE